jgi:ribosomal protein L37AE/L43A
MVQVECPFCKKMFTVRNNMMGKKVWCKSCGAGFVLGGTEPSIQQSPLASEPPKPIVENK